ncbi:MAG: tetratricopeptide repeat protein [Bacteroidota bacterium]
MEKEKTHDISLLDAKGLLKKAFEVRVSNLELSIELANQALSTGQQIKNSQLIAEAKNHLGLFYMVLGKFKRALHYAEEALDYYEGMSDLRGIADAKYTIAGVHYKTDNFHVGLEFLLDCLFIYRKLGDSYNEARVLKSMGTIYEYFGDLDNAIESYLRSVEAGQTAQDPNLESNAYNPLSGIYLKRGMNDLALSTIEKSISIKEQTKDIRGLAFALYGRGKIYLKTRKFDLAMTDLTQSLQLQEQMGDQLGICMARNKMGLLHYELREYDEAKKHWLKALEISNEYNIRFIRYKSVFNLHLLARSEGNTQEALDYLEKYISIKETMINSHTYNVIKSYEAISRVKSLEREADIQRSKTEIIEKKNAELDSFFYRVSHDLKGPISSLLGLNNLMKHEVKDPDAQRYLNMYQSQIMRINNIVLDLIDLTRMNHAEVNLVKINFETLLNECINTYRYLENFNSIKFNIDIDSKMEFYSEWAIVNTILQNLIENAIKYSKPHVSSFVNVSIAASGKFVKIVVEDNGIGIDPELQAKVFNMFFRANDRVDGTGLGLYILKRAVERLHGEVLFESTVHQGTRFEVMLPFTIR